MSRIAIHSIVALFLTILTQIGGLAWLFALFFRRKLIAFVLAYTALTGATVWMAPYLGRVALSCLDTGALQVQSWIYCALNRNYVTPELYDLLINAAEEMDQRFPGTETLVLDANFPFLDGFPLLPHLSHDDGEKVDLALFYQDDGGYLSGKTRSPIGYFAFEQGPTECPSRLLTLRWDLDSLQPLWREYTLDTSRNAEMLRILSRDPRVDRIFVEPHLARTLNVAHSKIRFQGCRAARHDDHIHFQIK